MMTKSRSGDDATAIETSAIPVEADASNLLYAVDFGRPVIADHGVEELAREIRRFADAGLAESQRYQLAERLAHAAYPKFKFSEFGRSFLEDRDFIAFYMRFMDAGNWHSLDRKYTLDQLLRLVDHLPGDIAECGCYKGFSAYLLCKAIAGSTSLVHLFDSFEGLSEPGVQDGDYWVKGGLSATEAALNGTLSGFANYRVYKGWIPHRFDEVGNRRFRFVHIDVDLYRPTYDSLAFFYPLLQPAGILLLDDYGFESCPGARSAADAFFAAKPERLAKLPTGQAFIIKR